MTTNITEEHRRAFQALTSGEHGNFALFSVFDDGEPDFEIRPLFVSPTPSMTVTDHDGRAA